MRCQCITKKNKQCLNLATDNSKYCHIHKKCKNNVAGLKTFAKKTRSESKKIGSESKKTSVAIYDFDYYKNFDKIDNDQKNFKKMYPDYEEMFKSIGSGKDTYNVSLSIHGPSGFIVPYRVPVEFLENGKFKTDMIRYYVNLLGVGEGKKIKISPNFNAVDRKKYQIKFGKNIVFSVMFNPRIDDVQIDY